MPFDTIPADIADAIGEYQHDQAEQHAAAHEE